MDIVLPTWLGSFYGCDFDLQTYEKLTVSSFGIGESELESAAFNNRWFDYQRLHSLQATYYFAKVYSNVYTTYFNKYFGSETKAGVSRTDFLQMREAKSFWRLRRYCDIHGFEYRWYLNSMMDYRLSTTFKNRIPRPCHLMPKGEEEQALKLLWDYHTNGDVLVRSVDPYFLTLNWTGDLRQISYEQFLISQVAKKKIKRYALHDLVYNQKSLRIEAVAFNFPDEVKDVVRLST